MRCPGRPATQRDASRLVMKRIGEKWTYHVLLELADEPRRFREILRGLKPVQTKVLSETLVRLEQDGFIRRAVEDGRPPQVLYQLSELGRDLLDLMECIAVWASKNDEQIRKSRRQNTDQETYRQTCPDG